MKQVCTLLLLMMPFLIFAQGKKDKKEKPTPEQLAEEYLKEFQQGMGFDSVKVKKHWMAGKEEYYPELTFQFTVNVTTNAKSAKNFEPYTNVILDTLLHMRHKYIDILLDVSGRKYQRMVEQHKYTETKTYLDIDYGRNGDPERMGRSLAGNVYAPKREY